MELIELRLLNRLTVPQAAELFDVAQRTWRAWERGERKVPRAVTLALQMRLGKLDAFDLPGWQASNGKIITPDGVEYTAGEINAIYWNEQLARTYKAEIRRLEKYKQLTDSSNDNDNVIDDLRYELE